MKEGKQIATVQSHYLGESAGGTPFVGILFKIDGGDSEGETIESKVYITGDSLKIARKSLKAIGFDIDGHQLEELDQNHELCAGNKAELDIQEEEYKGKWRLKVAWINPISKKPKGEQLKKLTDQLRAAKKVKVEEGEVPEEDIPF